MLRSRARRPCRSSARVATVTLAAAAMICTWMLGEARAGCGDGACGRVDWTEVTDMDQGVPVAAKIHGAYAWEASPDFWATHPLAGTVSGYFWLTCLSPSGTNAVCRGQLAAEMAKAGTDKTMTFGGAYFDSDAGAVIRPAGLFAEGEPASPAPLADLLLGNAPINPEVCRTALALPRNAGDAGVADASGSGGTGGGPAADEGGCSTAGRGSPAHAGFGALAFLAALIEVVRRRSRD
jgi:hypothetical protein